ncbi:putative DNA binding domain-containing protein [Sulfurimonas sp. HSL-3221]|uniref:ATP-binding protein n=1 Tax=Thiomicrolovo sulfuroxydans TaxID=2894755 RepID=UPI001E2DBF52|nr:ATP-binding protein [Sulfurimonas sp. HSL-3221]UFS62631.1 putative DNA binding domain-containing protein [Sulfurimonas sp. HSL-3221]
MKHWENKAIALLDASLYPIPQELNELDWKESLSPNNKKLSQHLCAFANYAGGGFLVFGVNDISGELVGISKKKAEEILQRLSSLARDTLEPVVSIDHLTVEYKTYPVLIVHIPESKTKPVYVKSSDMMDGTFIRTGGSTRHASRQEIGSLMLHSKTPTFEELYATPVVSKSELLALLEYSSVFELLDKPIPQSFDDILRWLVEEKMIEIAGEDQYYITNLGALVAAHDLRKFDGLRRKTIRVIKYNGTNKVYTEKEKELTKGYAISFEDLLSYLHAMLPQNEIIEKALRRTVVVYPEIALRELVANALIHQDFTVRGAGPMVEIYDDRIEISNPGKLLPSKHVERLIGTTPQSRNELLASHFRRYNICEERGTGFQKTITAIELYGLPPLKLEEGENYFRATMYMPKKFADMTPEERLMACYQHAVIQYLSNNSLTNSSLRERFKMHEKQRSMVSRLIKEGVEKKLIKPKNPESESSKFAEYIPFWG